MTTKIEKDIRISPRYRVSHWKNLDFSNNDSHVWEEAVKIFFDRIDGRFLTPVKKIESSSFSGFVVLAIDCLLIETLYQFYNGLDETGKNHQRVFWFFFRNSSRFKPPFTRTKAELFYSHFRCGILHQAQTKMLSEVRIKQEEMIKWVDEKKTYQGLIVDRKKFHKALCDEIDDYKQRLLNPQTEKDFDLRVKFRDKMAFIAK